MDERNHAQPGAAHDAFISYSRKDGVFARQLERALENYKPPKDLPVPQRHLDIFRDEEDFSGTEYSRAVDLHLTQSKKLILLCSPAARASRYVDDEIERFLRSHDAGDVIPVLVAGIPNNEGTAADEPGYAFPRELCKALEIPLAADFRGIDPVRDRLDRGGAAGAWFALLANLYGQSRAAIEQREARRLARSRRITGSVVGGIILALSIALAVSLVFRNQAVKQRDLATQSAASERKARENETKALHEQERLRVDAEKSRDEAVRQRAVAEREAVAARRETAERLAVQAVEKLGGQPEQALRIGMASIESFHRNGDPLVPAAIGALQKATLAFGGGMLVMPQSDSSSSLLVSDDLRWAAQSDENGNVRFGPVGTRTPRNLPPPSLPRGARWSRDQTHLAFGTDQLIAIRGWSAERNGSATQAFIWTWKIDVHGNAGRAVVLDTFPLEGSRIKIFVAPQERWIAWSDGWEDVYLRPLAQAGKALKVRCDLSLSCSFAFSGSRLALVAWGRTIERFELPDTPGAAPVALTPLTWDEGAGTHRIAVFNGPGPVEKTADGDWKWGEVSRLAVLTDHGTVRWWNLHEPQPAMHSTPSMLEPYRQQLTLSDVDQDHIGGTITWNPAGSAVMVTVTHDQAEFGIAAINVLVNEGPWQPLWHRYDGKAFETSSVSSSSGPSYAVLDSANLGVASASWMTADSVLTLGFDGTLWWRDLDRMEGNRFQLVARDVAAVNTLDTFILIGGRDGRVRFLSTKEGPGEPTIVLNGHDAALQELRVAGVGPRLLTIDTRGSARCWDFSHPTLASWISEQRWTEGVVSADARWLVTTTERGGIELRSAEELDSLAAPRRFDGSKDGASLALDASGRWAGALDTTTGSRVGLRLRLWSLEGDSPADRKPVERQYRIPDEAAPTSWTLTIVADGSQARAILTAPLKNATNVYGYESPRATWVSDSSDHFAGLKRIGPRGTAYELFRSDDLRWMVVKSGTQSTSSVRYYLVDLEQSASYDKPIPLPATTTANWMEFSADAQWLRLELAEYKHCVLSLAKPRGRCIQMPRNHSYILFGPQRAPIARAYGGEVAVLSLDGARFLPFPKLKGSKALAWDATGHWLVAAQSNATLLFRVDGATLAPDAEPIELPAPAQSPGEIERVFAWPEFGWIAAVTDSESLLLWHRAANDLWEAPVVLDRQDLRSAHGATDISLRDGGRALAVGDQVVSLDPARLLRRANGLLSGRALE
jgi:hypothetical protein